MREADRPAIAPNPALNEVFDAAGVTDPEAQELIRVAAGNYTRGVQAIERANGMDRDIAQTAHNRTLCERHQAVLDITDRHNEGVQTPR